MVVFYSWVIAKGILLLIFNRDTPYPRAKEQPQQDDRRGKFAFRIKPHSRRRRSEGSNQPCVHQDPETPRRLRQNYVWVSPMEVWVSSGMLQRQGLWVQQTWVWHKPSGRRLLINPTIELPELTQDWGNRLLEGTNRTLCAPLPRRKEQRPHKRLTETCPGVSRSLPWRHVSAVACCRVGGIECTSACMGLFEGHYLH